MGNTADADRAEWPKSVRKVAEKFKQPAYVIPGHGPFEINGAIDNTLMLLEKEN